MAEVKQRVLYLPSTPLNLVVCVAHAIAYQDSQQAELVLIDQREVDANPYMKALLAWQDSPFQTIRILSGQAKGVAKRQERADNFAKIREWVDAFQPTVIGVGSDRRIEFQYAMHYCQQQKMAVEGWYFDDGYYSYAGRIHKWYKDWASAIVKKLVYGSWWDEPQTIGSSKWINQAWLFSPKIAHPLVASKPMKSLRSEWFHAPTFQTLSQAVFQVYGLSQDFFDNLKQLDVLWVLPHPADFQDKSFRQQVDALLEKAVSQGLKVGVKYHPRFSAADEFDYAGRFNAMLMPNGVAFEFLLPSVSKGLTLFSGLGTSLMTAVWLGEALKVHAVILSNTETSDVDTALYKSMGIPVHRHCNEITFSQFE